MTSGVGELEALLSPRLFSFTTPLATGTPKGLRQNTAVFRAASKPHNIVTATPSLTEVHVPKQYDVNNHDFVNAGDLTSATSTTFASDERIDVVLQLVKQINLVNTEAANHIRELIQSVKEIKIELRDLLSVMMASNPLASNDVSLKMGCPRVPHSRPEKGFLFYKDHPPSLISRRDAVESCAMLTPVNKAQEDPSPNQDAAGRSSSPPLPTLTHRQPILAVTRSAFIPSPIIPDRPSSPPKPPSLRVTPKPIRNEAPIVSLRSRRASEVMELPPLPRVPSPAPCPVAVSAPVQTPTTAFINPPCSTKPPSPVRVSISLLEAVPPPAGAPQPVLSDTKPNGCTSQTRSRHNGKNWDAREISRKACAPSDTGSMDAEEIGSSKNSVVPESSLKSVLSTTTGSFSNWKSGKLSFTRGDQDSPNPPLIWMDGELAPTSGGSILAQYATRKKAGPTNKSPGASRLKGKKQRPSAKVANSEKTCTPLLAGD